MKFGDVVFVTYHHPWLKGPATSSDFQLGIVVNPKSLGDYIAVRIYENDYYFKPSEVELISSNEFKWYELK